jgi:hypothetical protein
VILLPWIFIALVFGIAYYGLRPLGSEYLLQTRETSPKLVDATSLLTCLNNVGVKANGQTVTMDAWRVCLASERGASQAFDEIVKPRLDEAKWMVTIIGTIGAFFVIAQAGAAWFTAQVYTKQAEDGLRTITATQEAIKARYPLFEDVERIRNNAFTALDKVFSQASKSARDSDAGSTEALDWKDNLYRKPAVEDRQRLLSVESFASIDLHPGPFGNDEHADVLRKFSLFYRSKFLYEDSVGIGAFGDLERAESYLRLAYAKKVDFTFKNDLGSLYLSYSS